MIRDALLARQLRADQRARGVARRLAGSLARWWPNVLRHIPDGPAGHFRQDRFHAELITIRQLLADQLRRDLFAVGTWAGETAARSLTAAIRRHRLREMADEFRTGSEPPDSGGGGTDARTATGEVIIEPPPAFEIMRIVGPAPLRLTKLFDPDRIAAQVWAGIADGQNRTQIAKTLSTFLNGDMVAARRVARTEGLRVATAMTLQTSEQIADLVVGYQVYAVLDDRTRPEHRARDGTIYYRNPKSGQKGLDQMPQPPIDPGGKLAYNCRCFISPVFAD